MQALAKSMRAFSGPNSVNLFPSLAFPIILKIYQPPFSMKIQQCLHQKKQISPSFIILRESIAIFRRASSFPLQKNSSADSSSVLHLYKSFNRTNQGEQCHKQAHDAESSKHNPLCCPSSNFPLLKVHLHGKIYR